MKSAGWSLAKGERRAVVAALCSVLLASCTSAGDPTMSVGMPGYNATASDIKAASSANPASSSDSSQQVTTASAQAQSPEMTVMAEGDTPLPEKVA